MQSATLTALLNKIVPTSAGPDAYEFDDSALITALNDPGIRSAVVQCARTVETLVAKTALDGFLRASLKQANTENGVSPVHFLEQQLAVLQREIAAADTRAALQKARWKVKSDASMPLMLAAGAFSSTIAREREILIDRIVRAGQTLHSSTISGLQRGLTHDEITKLGLLEPSPTTVSGWRERVNVIDGHLAQIAAYSSDPLKSTAHLAGLPIPGFDFAAKGGHAEAAV